MRDYLIVVMEAAQEAGKIIKEKIGTITESIISYNT